MDSEDSVSRKNFESIIHEQLDKDLDVSYYERASTSLQELLNYPFREKSNDGIIDERYNGVERINVVRDKTSRSVRCPVKFLDVVKYIEKVRGKTPSIGMRYKEGSSTNYVHLILEETKEGWIYIDNKRMLQVRQIHKIEKILDKLGLKSIGLIANQIGVPARNEVSRINTERGKIIDLHYFDQIHNHTLAEYF